MINRNDFVNLEDKIVAIAPNSEIDSDFLPQLWQHNPPRALLFCPGYMPAALMVRQVEISSRWLLPSTTVPIPPDIYSSMVFMGPLSLTPLVRMMNQSHVCLSFEFDNIDDKLLMAPYRREFGLNVDEAIYFQGDREECKWLQYQSFIQEHGIMPKDGQRCIMSFEEYVEYRKTPEERLLELCGLSSD